MLNAGQTGLFINAEQRDKQLRPKSSSSGSFPPRTSQGLAGGTVRTSSLTAAVAGSCREEVLGLGSMKGVLRNPAAP